MLFEVRVAGPAFAEIRHDKRLGQISFVELEYFRQLSREHAGEDRNTAKEHDQHVVIFHISKCQITASGHSLGRRVTAVNSLGVYNSRGISRRIFAWLQ